MRLAAFNQSRFLAVCFLRVVPQRGELRDI